MSEYCPAGFRLGRGDCVVLRRKRERCVGVLSCSQGSVFIDPCYSFTHLTCGPGISSFMILRMDIIF